ncbi:MAG: hypothetical protein RL885_33300 [Planctomycetota bacterium]
MERFRIATCLLPLLLFACGEEGLRSTPEATVENAIDLMRERNVETCAQLFLTEDFLWGNKDRDASVKEIKRYLKEVESFTVQVSDLETEETSDSAATFQLSAIVGMKLSKKSEFFGLPFDAVPLKVEGQLRFTDDGWRIASFMLK